ncbi:MAG: enoyl-CoA hydratase-related protein [Candidatus Limnocylindrales bacterium]
MSASGFETIRYRADGAVATITLARPAALNALDRTLKTELLAAIREAARDRAVRVLILTGEGRAFCAGQDLKERFEPGTGAIGRVVRERYTPIILGLRRLEKPVIAAVNGVAAGAGVSLALAADIRLAADSASFTLAFARVGLVPDSGASWFLPRLVGYARAAELIFTTDPVPAAEAERIGLVNRVVPAERLLDEARTLASRLATMAPLALALAKRELGRAMEVGLEKALDYEASLQAIAGRSADHAEGLAAFLEKRPPRFEGH